VACKVGRMLYCKESRKQSEYKLIYFAARGRAELARILFNVAGQSWDDVRYPIDPITFERKAWEADSHKMPFRKIPVLEVDGKQVAQSHAIERFLAKRFNLFGDCDVEGAQIDALCEQFVDVKELYNTAKKAEKEGKKEGELKKFFTTELPKQFGLLEAVLVKNGGEWFAGKRMSLADLAFFHLMSYWDDQESLQAALVDSPKLRALKTKVEQNEAVANWIATRPKTSM